MAGADSPPCARIDLHPLQRLGSFLKPLSAKNICSPAVKTNSAPHSEHFRTLSWYSMSRSPLALSRGAGGLSSHNSPKNARKPVVRGTGLGSLGPIHAKLQQKPNVSD